MSDVKPMTAENLAYLERKHTGRREHASLDCVVLLGEIRRLQQLLSPRAVTGISETSGGDA